MAKYLERLQELLDAGKIDQAEYDDLAELSAAKEAIKEFNSTKAELDELKAFKTQVETAPKRKEALSRVGIDYDALPRYGQKALDSIPADKLDDLDFVAGFVKDEGFEASVRTDDSTRQQSGAEAISNALAGVGQGTPVRSGNDNDALFRDLDAIPDGDKELVREVLAKHGRLMTDNG